MVRETYLIVSEYGDPSKPAPYFDEVPVDFDFNDAVSAVARADAPVLAVYRAVPGEVLADVSKEIAAHLTRCVNLSTEGARFVDYCGFVPRAAE